MSSMTPANLRTLLRVEERLEQMLSEKEKEVDQVRTQIAYVKSHVLSFIRADLAEMDELVRLEEL